MKKWLFVAVALILAVGAYFFVSKKNPFSRFLPGGTSPQPESKAAAPSPSDSQNFDPSRPLAAPVANRSSLPSISGSSMNRAMEVQRTLQSIQEINRMNQMNQQFQKREKK